MKVERPDILNAIPWDRSAVIEASAGTGKTYTLVHMVIELLLVKKVPFQKIVLLTFSEKAAVELKHRMALLIHDILNETESAEKGWKIDDEAVALLKTALNEMNKSYIMTIHAFLLEVLQTHAFKNQQHIDLEMANSKSLFERAFRAVMRQKLSSDKTKALIQWRQYGNDISKIEDLLFSCYQGSGHIKPIFTLAEIKIKVADILQGFNKKDWQEFYKASNLAKGSADAAKEALEVMGTLDKDNFDFISTLFILKRLNLKSFYNPILNKKNYENMFPEDLTAEMRLWLNHVEYFDAHISAESLMTHFFLDDIRAEVMSIKKDEGLLEFSDMIHRVKETLEKEDDGSLLASLRERFPYALVDEFQDTDHNQWAIFKKIYVQDSPCRIYLVGDPKQAIYSFRGADVNTYHLALNEMKSLGAPVSLPVCYRSTATFIKACHLMFGSYQEQTYFTDLTVYPEALTGQAEGELYGKGKVLKPVVLVEPPKFTKNSDFSQPYFNYMADEINKLLSDDTRIVHEGEERALKPEDIFILTTTNAESEEVIQFMHTQGIHCQLVKQSALFKTPSARHLLSLLKAIKQPRSQPALKKAWLTPFFNIDIADLNTAGETDETSMLKSLLMDLNRLAQRGRFMAMFKKLLTDSGYSRRCQLIQMDRHHFNNTEHLVEWLLAEQKQYGYELGDMIRKLEEVIVDKNLFDELKERDHVGSSSIKVMTCHGSKGLEAEVVFIYTSKFRSKQHRVETYHDNDQRQTFVGDAPQVISELITQEKDRDEQRLMYVACTRAKRRLIIGYPLKKTVKGLLAPLKQRLDALRTDPELKDNLFSFISIPRDHKAKSKTLTAQWPTLPDVSELQHRSRAKSLRIDSYSSLKRKSQYTEPTLIQLDKAEEYSDMIQDDSLPSGKVFGLLFHELMEFMNVSSFKGLTCDVWSQEEKVMTYIKQGLQKYGYDESHYQALAQLCYQAWNTSMMLASGQKKTFIDAEQCRAEFEFMFDLPEFPTNMLMGIVDMAVVLEGHLYFLDWKTDHVERSDATGLKVHTQQHYSIQMDLYARALKRLSERKGQAYGGMIYAYVRYMNVGEDNSGIYLVPDTDINHHHINQLLTEAF